jgi:hypothetical protein
MIHVPNSNFTQWWCPRQHDAVSAVLPSSVTRSKSGHSPGPSANKAATAAALPRQHAPTNGGGVLWPCVLPIDDFLVSDGEPIAFGVSDEIGSYGHSVTLKPPSSTTPPSTQHPEDTSATTVAGWFSNAAA